MSRRHRAFHSLLTTPTGQLDGSSLPKEYHHVVETQQGYGDGPQIISTSDELETICGPLLNYQRMSEEGSNIYWHGSVLLVTKPGQKMPQLELESSGGTLNAGASSIATPQKQLVDGLKLYADPDKTFWRFSLQVPLLDVETRWKYTIPNVYFMSNVSKDKSREFVVPAKNESMRIMFHSCNGFSVGTDEDFWSGRSRRIEIGDTN
jgi:hypothetical protein